MAHIPIELWHLIFDHLELVDLFSCALVSKAIYFAVKEYRIREIAFVRRVHQWFHYTTPTNNHKHQVDFSSTPILKRSSFDFNYLKRLKIGRSSAIDLKVINRFVHLEELDIDLAWYGKKKSRTLSLTNLKVLYLFVPDNIQSNLLHLDTPRLVKVRTLNLAKLEFVYPESVRCIHTFSHAGKLSMFHNLETLVITDYYDEQGGLLSYGPGCIKEFSVANLKKLKEVEFYYRNSLYEENMSILKRMIENLLRQSDLKVFWYNVQVTDPDLLTEYERMEKSVGSLLAFQILNYGKLKRKVNFFWWYDFNPSMKQMPKAGLNPRSEQFFSKLLSAYSFRRIKVTGKVEELELLLKLISRSSNLFALEFWNSDLDQSFFNRMADIVRLNAIPLRQFLFLASNKSLNFDFVTKFLDLELFEADQQLPSELITKLCRLPLLARIKYLSDQKLQRIDRLSANRFRLNGRSLSRQELLSNFDAKPASFCSLM